MKAYGTGAKNHECCDLRHGCCERGCNKNAERTLKKRARQAGKKLPKDIRDMLRDFRASKKVED